MTVIRISDWKTQRHPDAALTRLDNEIAECERELVMARASYRKAGYGGVLWLHAANEVCLLTCELQGLEAKRSRMIGEPLLGLVET